MIEATAAAGHTTDELVAEIDKVLAAVSEEGLTAEEVTNAQTQYEVGFYNRMRTIGQIGNSLNSYFFFTGEPDSFQKDLDRFLQVTPESATEWKDQVLSSERVELHVRPPTAEELAADDAASEEGGEP
jgi:predicted Zn-dependent peptidase